MCIVFPNMDLHEMKVGDVLILQPEGHLDTAAATPMEEQVLKMIQDGERKVLVDCSGLQYVNSSGLKVFLVSAKRLDSLGGKLVTCSLAPNVRMIFEMIGFTKILTIFPERAEALAYFQGTKTSV